MFTATLFINPDSSDLSEEAQIIAKVISPACIDLPGYPTTQVQPDTRLARPGELGGHGLLLIYGVQNSFIEYGRIEREKAARIIFTEILGPYIRIGVHLILNIPAPHGESISAGGGLNTRMERAAELARTLVMAHRDQREAELRELEAPTPA